MDDIAAQVLDQLQRLRTEMLAHFWWDRFWTAANFAVGFAVGLMVSGRRVTKWLARVGRRWDETA